MKEWFIDEDWKEVFDAKDTHEKAEVFQNKLIKVENSLYGKLKQE